MQTTVRNYRVPDVVVFDRDHPIEQILTRPPIAVFEVLSPEDRMSGTMVKLREYEAMGIPTIMVIDPQVQTISQFFEGDLIKVSGVTQQLAGSRCSIDWAKIRELLD